MSSLKCVAMVPARLGSKRVPRKNLRYLGDRPLAAHVLSTAVASGVFDAVYLNSEAPVLEKLAAECGARFYRRPDALAGDAATNDQFALDFMEDVPCDLLVQINPTSPFLEADDFRRARAMFDEGCDTVLAVEEKRIEGVFRDRPVNFNPLEPMPPSQELTPIYVFCNGILAWRCPVYKENIRRRGCAVYGGEGKTGYLVLRGDAVLDIDREEDFALAERVWEHRNISARVKPRYWEPK